MMCWMGAVSCGPLSSAEAAGRVDVSRGAEGASVNPLSRLDHSLQSLPASGQLENHTGRQYVKTRSMVERETVISGFSPIHFLRAQENQEGEGVDPPHTCIVCREEIDFSCASPE